MNQNLERILSEEEMGRDRCPDDLFSWVEMKAEELSSTKELKEFSRSGKRLPKKLWEEIRPFALFSKARYSAHDHVICKPNLGNENYDGVISFSDSDEEDIYIEITYAKDGYDERLRLDVLNKNGSVNALAHIKASGTKASGNREIEVDDSAVNHDDVRNAAIPIVENCIREKCDGRYSKKHILIVVIDDYLGFRTEEDRNILLGNIRKVVQDLNPIFKEIVLLGASGNCCLSV